MEGKGVYLLCLPSTRLIAMKYSGCFSQSAGTSGPAFIATASDMKQMIQQLVPIRTSNADQVGHHCLGILEMGSHKTLNEWEMQERREQITHHCDLVNGLCVVGNRETCRC